MFVWVPSMLGASAQLYYPEHLGGVGNLSEKVQQVMQSTGKSYLEAAKEVRVMSPLRLLYHV